MNEQVEKYILSMIPANIPAKQTKDIYDEFACHLYDRIDFFMEIGYDEQASIDKAIEEFGSSEEVTGQIAKQFEELYHERTWVAIVVGIGALVVNILSLVSGAYIGFLVEDNNNIGFFQMFCGFVIMFCMLITTMLCYKKGYEKTLGCFGGANILIGLSIFFSLYPQMTIYILLENISYLIDRYTSCYAMDGFDYSFSIALYGAIIFPIVFGIINVYLAFRISNKGLPKNRSYKAVILFVVMYFISAVGSLPLNFIADEYFYNYNEGFYICQNGLENFDSDIISDFDNTTDMKKAEEFLKEKGYINADEFETTLDKNTAKRFRKYINQSYNAFDENYTVYFQPVEENDTDSYSDLDLDSDSDTYIDNAKPFVFLLGDENGKIKSKGIGSGSKIPAKYSIDEYYNFDRYDPVKLCAEDFKSLKLGESKVNIQKRIKDTYGKIYATFITYTDKGINEYYKIYCSYNDVELLESYFPSIYFQISFENGILTAASMHSNELDQFGYSETETAVYIK